MKTFKPSLTGETKFVIGFLLFYWIFGTLISLDSNGLRGTVNVSLLTLIFCLAFGYGWFKQTYLVISDGQVKYVSFFIQRETANISDVKMVTTSIVTGFMKFLCIIYYRNGKEKLLQISPVGFSKQTLNDFVSELRKINPQIEIHKSAKTLLTDKTKKSLPTYKITGIVGVIISVFIVFAGISYKDIGILGLLTPLGILLGIFFSGYQMKGKLKDGFLWVISLIILFALIITLSYLLK